MQFQHPLSVVTPTLDGDLLTALAHAEVWFTPHQLQRVLPTDRSTEGIRRALRRLTEQGIVDAEQVGRASRYRLNRDHLGARPILELANLRSTFVTRLEDELRNMSEPPVYGALFGSAARGDMRPDSDIDILLVRADDTDLTGWEHFTDLLSRRVTRWTGNDAQIYDLDESTARAAAAGGDPVLVSVVKEGLTIAGRPDWLRALLRRHRVARSAS